MLRVFSGKHLRPWVWGFRVYGGWLGPSELGIEVWATAPALQ